MIDLIEKIVNRESFADAGRGLAALQGDTVDRRARLCDFAARLASCQLVPESWQEAFRADAVGHRITYLVLAHDVPIAWTLTSGAVVVPAFRVSETMQHLQLAAAQAFSGERILTRLDFAYDEDAERRGYVGELR